MLFYARLGLVVQPVCINCLLHSAVLQPAGLKRDVLYCYDLELPADFVPKPLVRAVCHGTQSRLGQGAGASLNRQADLRAVLWPRAPIAAGLNPGCRSMNTKGPANSQSLPASLSCTSGR